MDVLIFGGQSNMCGTTSEFPKDIFELADCYEYKFSENKLIPLKHPCGENIGEELESATDANGCLIPSFVRAYKLTRNSKVVAVHAAKGRTMLCHWKQGTKRYDVAKNKILAAIEKANEYEKIEHIYYIWLQGESDATHKTSIDDYYNDLIAYKNHLKKDIGIEKFGIIKVGYFSKEDEFDYAIQQAQEECAKDDSDFLILTRVCEFLSKNQYYMNPLRNGHYDNDALNIIGSCAGECLGRYAINEINKGEDYD